MRVAPLVDPAGEPAPQGERRPGRENEILKTASAFFAQEIGQTRKKC
jgi:hypothetical protein